MIQLTFLLQKMQGNIFEIVIFEHRIFFYHDIFYANFYVNFYNIFQMEARIQYFFHQLASSGKQIFAWKIL